jgi:hypothetical protein
MSGKKHGASGVDNTHRKTWDREEFHEKAKEREIKVCFICKGSFCASVGFDCECSLFVCCRRKKQRTRKSMLENGKD